jgi:hypothetical protein
MNATSSEILNTGLDAMVTLFQNFLTFALTNWIPVVLAIVVVVSIIGLIVGKTKGIFGKH